VVEDLLKSGELPCLVATSSLVSSIRQARPMVIPNKHRSNWNEKRPADVLASRLYKLIFI